jgi:nucleoside-diphosphate-sugar epimerase
MEPPERILLTGAAGFIGSHLTRKLIEEGYTAGILTRTTTNLWRVGDVRDRLGVFIADLRDADAVTAALTAFRPRALLHLATYYAVEHRPQEIGVMVDTNVKGTINLLEACRHAGVPLFVNTSTCAVYRDTGRFMSETDPVAPQNLYALTKFQAEEACRFYGDRYGIGSVSLRLFPPYGPADNDRRLIPYVIRALLTGEKAQMTTGMQRWDFVYVDDIVSAFLAVLARPEEAIRAGVFNVGTSEPHTVREVVTALREIVGSRSDLEWGALPHRPSEIWFNSAEIRRIREVLGWQPQVSLHEGLRRTVEWHRTQKREHAGD